MFTQWLLYGFDSEYNSFCIMLNNGRKAKQAKEAKTEPGWYQSKGLEARSMKTSSKPKDKKKNHKNICLYCLRPAYIEDKYYYEYLKLASQNLWGRFKDWIKELQSKTNRIRSYLVIKDNIENAY